LDADTLICECGYGMTPEDAGYLRKQLAAVTAERDRLRKALEGLEWHEKKCGECSKIKTALCVAMERETWMRACPDFEREALAPAEAGKEKT
jgi:hypothetical protein